MNTTDADATYREVVEFLMREAELLDDRKFEEWMKILTEDVYYYVPLRTSQGKDEGSEFVTESAWFSENWKSLQMRIKRLRSQGIVAENPPSRTRHFVSNVRIGEGEGQNEIAVKCNLLVYRSRGESVHYDLFSGERRDVLRRVNGNLRLARRELLLDQAVLGAQDLSIIL